jgi:hypothetical protein
LGRSATDKKMEGRNYRRMIFIIKKF